MMSTFSKTRFLKDNITIKYLLFIQFVVFVVFSLFIYFKQPDWFLPALAGGLTGWLPNVVFTLFTQNCLTKNTVNNAISWSFSLAWIAKLFITVILLVIVMQVFKSDLIPIGLGFLSVIVMQFLAPVIVTCFYK